LSPDLNDGNAADDDRRTGREKPGHRALKIILAPQYLAAASVETGDDATDTEGYYFAVGHGGRAPRPGERTSRSRRTLRLILVLPDFCTRSGIEAADDLIPFLSRKHVESAVNKRRCGDAVTHCDLPFLY
jgi:hypothetical protein